ncbi:hypothetical protein M9M90_16670 [Phenylobacterium sp. LH3H17]|uniref:fimbrial biogenesis chaperone n=1 Tax=Phenylobacterium sp. LH3H17 TaxID=2903901 RepID=UPI0020C9ADE1|nr:hypothetical protein [Phenylobacterium sp. LH3H17]UTP38841.1 hypothetical protein M9M90_16670 [Phenylobacterium sp. LH3H17]
MNIVPVQFARLAAALFAALLLAPGTASAQVGADLNISPKRVVFDPNGRSASVYVFNQGDAPATYSVALVDRVMLDTGEIIAIDDAQKDPAKAATAAMVKSAKSLITFTPRRVTLAPKTSQLVRLRVLRPGDLAAGEYRTHLTVTAIPPEDTGVTAEQAAAGLQPGEMTVRVVALFSLSIPLIVRHGPEDVRGGVENLAYEIRDMDGPDGGTARKTGFVSLDLTRLGASSLYGDVEIRGGPKNEIIGGMRGIGVYPEIARRRVTLQLQTLPNHGDVLTVNLKDDEARPGAPIATGRLTVP